MALRKLRNIKHATMKKISNPFILTGYHSPLYFCDRIKELETLVEAVENERNITLFSLRRLGKTALIRHLYYHLEKRKGYATLYIDLLPTESFHSLTLKVANAVFHRFGKIDNKGFTKKIQGFLSQVGASLEFDQFTGLPSLSLNYQDNSRLKTSLRKIFEFLSGQDRKVIITLDEFQQINKYTDDNPEAFIRSLVQEFSSLRFIFCGSQRGMMISMFTDHGRPFYRSTQLMELHAINIQEYTKFINHHFQKAGAVIPDEVTREIFDWTRMQTYYVQVVCNRLYALASSIDKDVLHDIFQKILLEEQTIFTTYRNMLSSTQWKALVAIAKEGGVNEPTSGEFLKKHGIPAASSMKTAINALEKKELILKINDQYTLHDTLLMRWIQNFVD